MPEIVKTNGIGNNDVDDSENGADTTFENPVVKIFRGFPNVSDDTIRLIRESGITQKDLSALNDTDLELFGVKDVATRLEMTTKFSNSPNQHNSFDKFVQEMDGDEYQHNVYQNVVRELRHIDTTLKAMQMTLKACPITHDKTVIDDVYISSLNMKALKEILKVVSQVTDSKKQSKRGIWTYAISGAILLASITILHKIIKN